MIALSNRGLGGLSPEVARPGYDRTALRTGIVHFGVGGFHRSHQAALLDQLMNAGEAREWAICGAGVRPVEFPLADALRRQEGLYTLVTKPPSGAWQARVIGSLTDYCHAAREPERLLERMAAPETRIISFTITEGGYNFDDKTGEFRFDEPAVARDLSSRTHPETVFGLVAEACRRRQARGVPGFTLLSCDNIQANGDTARKMFLAFAERRDPAAAAWMDRHVRFPNSMVDRITPATTEADRAAVRERFGIDDPFPVVCEPFLQWVLEDHFATGRPPWERVGVQLVENVEAHELMKLRLLNGGHQALAYLGTLHGLRYMHEAARDPVFAEFFLDYMREEVSSTLAPVPGIDLEAYRRGLLERFGNAAISDTLARICADTSDRIPKFIFPVIRHRLAQGLPAGRAAAVVASWARYAQGSDEQGRPIEVVDRRLAELRPLALRSAAAPLEFIRHRPIFGDLADDPRFAEAYLNAATLLKSAGARATAAAYRR